MVKFIGHAGPSGIDVGLHALVVFEIIREHDAAFPRGDELAGLKAESPQVAHRSRALATPLAAVRVGTVFDDLQRMFAGDLGQCIHIGETHAQVHWQNGSRFRGDGRLGSRGIHAIGFGIHIDKHRHRVYQQYRPHCAFPCVGRDQHLVAGPDVDRLERGLNGDRAGVDALAVGGVVQLGETGGELGRVLARERAARPRLDRVTHPVIASLLYPSTVAKG